MRKRVAVGLSGGVDSAVTAALLKEQGYEVVGVYLDAWEYEGCEVDENRRDALLVASKLKIPFRVLDVKKEYKKRVVDYFFETYKQGLTPNPDILCNSEIKFGIFYDWAMEKKFDKVATGHYARMVSGDQLSVGRNLDLKKMFVQRGRDKRKDQSYFLWKVESSRLENILFPLGEWLKSEVRLKAKELKLSVAEKPDSMGICFIGDVDVKKMLRERLGEEEGEVVIKVKNVERKIKNDLIVGKHRGLWFYTIGQRGGFEIDKKKLKQLGLHPEKMKPLYVVGKDLEQNRLIVGEREECLTTQFSIFNFQFSIREEVLEQLVGRGEVFVRVRNLGELYHVVSIKHHGDDLLVKVERGVFGVAPGQSAVFYWQWNGVEGDEIVVGGGVVV